MAKEIFKAGTMIYPLPAVMVSCGSTPDEYNIITVAWTGTINTNPPMCYISVRPGRHSHAIIKKNMAFVINLTTEKLAAATDWCGVKSGKDFNKFQEMGLSAEMALKVKAPIIVESPVNIECKVTEIKTLGSHDMFIAEVINVHGDSSLINPKTGTFLFSKSKPISYMHGYYYAIGKRIGRFGFSVKKNKQKRSIEQRKKQN